MAAIIFDLDGTLIDSAPAIHAVSNAVLADHGFSPLTADQVRSFVGRGVGHLVTCLLTAHGQDPDGPLHRRIEQALVARYETEVEGNTPYAGVAEALSALRDAGHRLAVCTNKPRAPALAALRHVGLLDFFPVVVGGDSIASRKPDPAMLFHALEAAGGGPLVYVGDSEIDSETALAAGAPFALYTEGYRKAPVSALPHAAAFADFAELPAIADRLLA